MVDGILHGLTCERQTSVVDGILHDLTWVTSGIKTKVKIVTKKKIFDLDPGKLYFINKRVKLREKKYIWT